MLARAAISVGMTRLDLSCMFRQARVLSETMATMRPTCNNDNDNDNSERHLLTDDSNSELVQRWRCVALHLILTTLTYGTLRLRWKRCRDTLLCVTSLFWGWVTKHGISWVFGDFAVRDPRITLYCGVRAVAVGPSARWFTLTDVIRMDFVISSLTAMGYMQRLFLFQRL